MNRELTSLDVTLVQLAHRYQEPKTLLEAVRREYPDVLKQDIVHAALLLVIEHAKTDAVAASELHRMVMENRAADIEPA